MKRPSSLTALAAVAAFTLAAPNAAADPAAIVIANQMKGASGVVTNATLAFESSSAKRGLYCAWGPSDFGADPSAWPLLERLKTIAPEATTSGVSLPEDWGESLRAVRWFLFDEEISPCYDWRVESVESDGATRFPLVAGRRIDAPEEYGERRLSAASEAVTTNY